MPWIVAFKAAKTVLLLALGFALLLSIRRDPVNLVWQAADAVNLVTRASSTCASAKQASLRCSSSWERFCLLKSRMKATPSFSLPSKSAPPSSTGTRVPSFRKYSFSNG